MNPLLAIEDLRVSFGSGLGRRHAKEVLHGISMSIEAGETLGLVGESGSGKTTIGRAVLGLTAASGGRIVFDGQQISHLNMAQRRKLAKNLQAVFQDPYTSLNPALTISDVLSEPLIAQGSGSSEARTVIADLLDKVGLPSDSARRLPREFSGGQRQRIAIARALALDPKLIVCDEPVSSLDLSTQGKVLDLLIEIQERTGVAYLFISHDLAVVRHISHRVAVLRGGHIVETGSARQVTSEPEHAYTKQLLLASPVADPIAQKERRERRSRLTALDSPSDRLVKDA
ncbi:ATP-binding cassette domain-containing protein [Arthrobacter castelli]|uniref:ATP-binding cassette domain-containing protein n=1 Tax=Arthrobacter castelli TaxID=271431 RepID=UPI0003F4DF77|nr:ATP-binding cassette domain-containing protein [Arthrobacter castelli]